MARPARVLLTADAVGGVWQYTRDVARCLEVHGIEAIVAVLGEPPARPVDDTRIIMLEHPLDWVARSPIEVAAAGKRIAATAKAVGADLVHLNAVAYAAEVRFDRPVVGVLHSCVATWWRSVHGGALPADLAWRADLVRRGASRVDALLAPTASFARESREVHGLARTPRVVRNGRDLLPGERIEPVREVVTLGRLWDEGKNVAAFDRMASRVDAAATAIGALAGPNGARAVLRHAATPGQLDDAAVALRLSRRPVFVSLARYEPFGLGVLEAAASGCALILSDIPTFRELWQGVATFVDPDDDAAAAAAADALLADPAGRRAAGDAAAARARRYSVESMIAGVLRAYAPFIGAERGALSA
ncbi:MAG: glycosyltransferase [Alphaproteobacteria bacterium]